jgi:hypothetical protein
MKPRRFTKGEPIRDLTTLVTLIEANRWVYWGAAPKHPAFLVSMTLRALSCGVGGGVVFHAIDNTKGPSS